MKETTIAAVNIRQAAVSPTVFGRTSRRDSRLGAAAALRHHGTFGTNSNGAAGVPPANLGFRLVAEPSQPVATSVVRNVAQLLRRT